MKYLILLLAITTTAHAGQWTYTDRTPGGMAVSGALNAQSGSYHDPNTGNFYHWGSSGMGTDVQGFNPSTGSTWSHHISRDGSMQGFDADFNPWTYEAGSKLYMNSGTGVICTGEGYSRFCY